MQGNSLFESYAEVDARLSTDILCESIADISFDNAYIFIFDDDIIAFMEYRYVNYSRCVDILYECPAIG